jgi:putative FmdB family regulatory protein
MPIYDYACRDCEKEFEVIVLPGEKSEVACPHCGRTNTARLLSPGAVRPNGIPKGSGGFGVPSCMNREGNRSG